MKRYLIPVLMLCCREADLAAKPNVVLVITDDQGYGDVACLGNPVLETPALDSLHSQSIRLTDYHVSPTCAPTRGALMSGHYTNRAGPWHTIMGRSFLRTESTTLGEVFSANGYRTGLFGKWHLGDNFPYRPIDRGFQEVVSHAGGGVGQTPDYWDNAYFDDTYMHNGRPQKYEGYCTDVFFREATRFISESLESGEPFLACISTNAPHSPFLCPDKYWQPYVDKVSSREEAVFYGMIANIDENIGRLRAFLEEKGIARNTIFIFTTDNGTATGDRIHNAGMRGRKASAYEGGHRVPFFLHWPAGGLDQPKDIGELTAHIDVLPTLIDLCGLAPPMDYSFDGRSLAPLLFNNPVAWPERTIVTDSQRLLNPVKWRESATMTSRWRLINGTELYDIKLDPGQMTDVAADHPDVVAQLRKDYETWWNSVSRMFDKPTRIVVGDTRENPLHLTCHDWLTDDEVTPWHQAHIREGKRGTGSWALHVATPGRYAITLRRWPMEANLPITAPLAPGQRVPGLESFRETRGQALSITSAIVAIGDFHAEKPVDKGSSAVTFELELPEGDADLCGTFRYGDGPDDIIGSYYATVTLLDDRRQHYPRFSWDTVPVYIHCGDRNGFSEESVRFITARSSLVCMSSAQGMYLGLSAEEGQLRDARRLKQTDPGIKVLFYWNAFLDYPRYEAHNTYQSHPDWWLRNLDGSLDKKDGRIMRYDLSKPEVRDWWTGVLAQALAGGAFDGVFMDALPQIASPANKRLWGEEKYAAIQAGLRATMRLARSRIAPSGLILFNGVRNSGNFHYGAEVLDDADGCIIEHFGHFSSATPESMAMDMAAVAEAGKRGKIVVFKAWPGFSWLDEGIKDTPREVLLEKARDRITFPLACFLAVAQPYSYFCYSWGYGADMGGLDWYAEYDKPLGKPLGDATIDGFRYAREFERCTVNVDLASREASIIWR